MTDTVSSSADLDKDAPLDAGTWTGADPVASDPDPLSGDLRERWAESAKSESWPRRSPRRARGRAAAVIAGVVIVGLTAVVVVGWLRIRHDDQLNAARAGALAAGSRDAALIATYSYNDFGAYTRQVEAMSTPQFAANFRKDSSSLQSVLAQYKAGSNGSVTGAGVAQVSTTRATVYVFLDEKVTNTKQSGTTERARMVVTLIRRGGRWLISNAVVQ